jgi:hypothetical protein
VLGKQKGRREKRWGERERWKMGGERKVEFVKKKDSSKEDDKKTKKKR